MEQANPQPMNEPAFALAPALDRLEGDQALLLELLDIFVQTYAGYLDGIARAIAAGDTRQAGHEAHSLKGSALSVGAERMATLAKALEQAGAAGELARMPVLLDQLRAAGTEFVDVQSGWRDSLSSAR